MEIEIRAGFCDPDGELLAVLERPDWRRVSIQRRDKIVYEMVRGCDERERSEAEARRRRDNRPTQFVIGYWHPASSSPSVR